MKRIDKVEESVERSHRDVGEGQVDNEVIGHSPHASVGQNNPDNGDVPRDGHQDDQGVGDSPQSHLKEERRSEGQRGEEKRGEEEKERTGEQRREERGGERRGNKRRSFA